MSDSAYDAVIIGSGPNGLAAGITLAREGLRVLILEAKSSPGGGMRTSSLTLPGFHHDVCSAVHPMAVLSPFLRTLALERFGLEWVHPEVLLSHPLDGGRAAAVYRDLSATAAEMPGGDGAAWRSLMQPFVPIAGGLFSDLLGPLPLVPRHPLALMRFGLHAMRPAAGMAVSRFHSAEVQALFAGNAAHSFLPLEQPFTSAVAMALAVAGHAGGWPVARGGSGSIVSALVRCFESLGGHIRCNEEVRDVRELPPVRAVLFDTGPHATARIAGEALPQRYRQRLQRYRYGPAVFKVDYALSAPVPWTHPLCRKAGTVHAGGTLAEVAHTERQVFDGKDTDNPFVLVAQQSLADATRAPAGQHTLWAYAHVPSGSQKDYSDLITGQIERFAPGFRDTILARHSMNPAAVAAHNANNVGGDIIGGIMDLRQMFTRPVARWNPYTTPNLQFFHCSSSTPPGAGVHGMCGYHAARTALRNVFGVAAVKGG